MTFTPIIIIGAPRSGTNMLRNVMTALSGYETWPCDEINYIWRHGHINHPTDEFPASFANEKTRKYIFKKFEWVSNRFGSEYVVEKTCANSLRVEFIYKLLPEAKFVFIYRNGLDVVGSAMKRWKAPLNIKYIAKKTRFVPMGDLPVYGCRYFLNRMSRVFSKESRLSVWGPKFAGLQELRSAPLDEICALQWKACVDSSAKQSLLIPDSQKVSVSYEQFVDKPFATLKSIVTGLDIKYTEDGVLSAVNRVSNKSVNRGRQSLTEKQRTRLTSLLGDTLEQHEN